MQRQAADTLDAAFREVEYRLQDDRYRDRG
jgi:hypothetical protein